MSANSSQNNTDRLECQSVSLPNHEKMSSDLLIKVCTYLFINKNPSKGDEILDVTVNVLSTEPPIIEGLQLDWKLACSGTYYTKIAVNKVQLLAASNYISRIEIRRH